MNDIEQYHKETSCDRKIDYKSPETALRAKQSMEKKTGRDFDAYECRFCQGFHIGNSMSYMPALTIEIQLR